MIFSRSKQKSDQNTIVLILTQNAGLCQKFRFAKNRQPPAGLLHDEEDPGIDRFSRRMSFDQFQHLVVTLASGCCAHFSIDLIRNLLSFIFARGVNML